MPTPVVGLVFELRTGPLSTKPVLYCWGSTDVDKLPEKELMFPSPATDHITGRNSENHLKRVPVAAAGRAQHPALPLGH
jgi:hypothetical protein